MTLTVIAVSVLLLTMVAVVDGSSELALTLNSEELKLKIEEFKLKESIVSIQKSFSNLPTDELERILETVNSEVSTANPSFANFTVDSLLNSAILPHSLEADALKSCWERRQLELEELSEKQQRPVDEMRRLMNEVGQFVAEASVHADYDHFRYELGKRGKNPDVSKDLADAEAGAAHLLGVSRTEEVAEAALLELESFLEDLDNARDFHTIGEWPVLMGYLESPVLGNRLKALVAWCIGTAVKNTEEYQMWLLDSAAHASAPPLHLLTQLFVNASTLLDDWDVYGEEFQTSDPALANRDCVRLQNKILYALSSAAGNNKEIEWELHNYVYREGDIETTLAQSMLEQLEKGDRPAGQLSLDVLERTRKIFNFVSDLLLEIDEASPELQKVYRRQYCTASWDVAVADHVELSENRVAADADLEKDCVNSELEEGETDRSEEVLMPPPEELRRRAVLASIQRAAQSVQKNMQLLCEP